MLISFLFWWVLNLYGLKHLYTYYTINNSENMVWKCSSISPLNCMLQHKIVQERHIIMVYVSSNIIPDDL